MATEKNYIWWSIKEITNETWSFFALSLKLDDLASCDLNDKWYIRLNIFKSKSPYEKNGKLISTHYMVENDFKPNSGWNTSWEPNKFRNNTKTDEIAVENIPF